VCLDRVEGPGILRATIPIGSANPLHLGSAGKILLAFSPASSWEELWHASRRQFPSGLEAAFPDLAAIRRQGYAISAGDRDDALASLSVPVLGTEGEAVAALSISGPISRLTEAKLQRYVPLLQRAAIEVGQELRVQLGVREDERAR
jgi:DNA-binding IclR family transcriptional regulator